MPGVAMTTIRLPKEETPLALMKVRKGSEVVLAASPLRRRSVQFTTLYLALLIPGAKTFKSAITLLTC